MGDARRDVGLFRYALIREAADLSLSKAERGLLVRSLAARDHVRPDGTHVRGGVPVDAPVLAVDLRVAC